jgi:cell division septal protein FtsQ
MTRKKLSSSRAAQVRTRRNQKPSGSDRKFEAVTRQMPPVMVRGGGYELTPRRKSNRKAKSLKRRYDISLAASPGAEMRLPAVSVPKLGWRALSSVIVIGLIALLYFMWTAPSFQVQMIEVQGANRLTAGDINRTLNLDHMPIFAVIPQQLENSLKGTYLDLLDVSVKIGLPAAVVVNINERTPLIEWTQDSHIQWIDGAGFAFPTRGQAENLVKIQAYAAPPRPAAYVENESLAMGAVIAPQSFMAPELVNGILTMRAQAPANTILVYDPTYGLGWSDARGWNVFFGSDVTEIETKLRVYNAIVEKLQATGIIPALISVEHVHAPFYRMEP